MVKNKGHFKVYSDSMRLLLGVTNETFPLSKWVRTEYWGSLCHYSFEDYYGEIEDIFKLAYKMILNPMIDSEEEEELEKVDEAPQKN